MTPGSVGLGARLAVLGLRVYQVALAPWFGPACRFEPSCSRYAITAIDRHGVVHGCYLALRRVARCNPLGGCGYDPVP
jgi:putative membrane protein insertion efficiency factor